MGDLLPNVDCYAAVRFVNNSGSRQVLKHGLCLDDEKPAIGPHIADVDAALSGNNHSGCTDDMLLQKTSLKRVSGTIPLLGSARAGSP